mgnify:CR=1 FL=1
METRFVEIKIRLSSKVIEDETANWKAYRNEDLGFEIKLPSENWRQCQPREGIVLLLVAKDQKCYFGPSEESPDHVIVSLQSDIFSESLVIINSKKF